MNAEQLDALLMDHALGETRGDLALLIDAYAEKDSAARAALDDWQALAGTARQTLHQAAPTTPLLPNFPRHQLERASKTRRWQPLFLGSSGMAACVCLGFLLGTQSQQTASPAPSATAIPLQHLSPSIPTHAAPVADFWSLSRVRALALQSKSSTTPAASLWTARSRAQFFGTLDGDANAK